MRKYQIVFAPTAAKQLKRLDHQVQKRIVLAITNLASDPFLGKLLKGDFKDYRSYRIGDYRVIYFVRTQKIQVEIIKIAHRREVYR